MSKFTSRPVTVEAVQWWKNGDHPRDNTQRGKDFGDDKEWEGEVVRYYRRPDKDGSDLCPACKYTLHEHGWLDYGPAGGYMVCPGDWIVTKGADTYPVRPSVFEVNYAPA